MEVVKDGVVLFQESVLKYCSYDLELNIKEKPRFDDTVSFSANDSYSMKDSLSELITKNQALQKNEIKLFVVSDLGGVLCGYAFPEITRTSYFKETFSILIQEGDISCGAKERLVAHELAHLFIQDNPPHGCRDNNGEVVDCPVDNILQNEIVTYSGIGRNLKPHYIQAKGLAITQKQCQDIQKTLNQIDSWQ